MLNKLIDRFRGAPVVYGGDFFTDAWFKEWAVLGNVLASMVESEAKWRKVLDFGCGPGVMIDLMTDRGMDYVGCDYSVEARQLYLDHYGRYPERYLSVLDQDAAGNRDLLMAFDVLEHMHDEEIEKLLDKTRSIPEALFNINRTRGIPGHINLKSDRAWIAFMKKMGFGFEEKRTRKLRQSYLQLRSGAPDRWDRNLFLFRRIEA